MAHRSNQAVASQDREERPIAPVDPPPKRPLLVGWIVGLGALVTSLAMLALALWLLRLPLAEFAIKSALADRGAEVDLKVSALDWGGIDLSSIRFGSETSPDASVGAVTARWDWEGLSPRLRAVHVVRPRLRLRLDPAGRVSAGTLDRLSSRPSGKRPSVPRIRLDIEDGQAAVAAPFGPLVVQFQSAGEIGQDFSALARIEQTSQSARGYALDNGRGELIVVSRDNTMNARLRLSATGADWDGAHIRDAVATVMARVPLDLSHYDVEAGWRVTSLRAPNISADALAGSAGAEALTRSDSLEPANWEGEAHLNAARFVVADNATQRGSFDAHFRGRETRGNGEWVLSAETFSGLAMTSLDPSASGIFRFDLSGERRIDGEARISLARTRLDARAQQDIRAAFPNMTNAPIGPTFAQAEHALDVAADQFDLTIPLRLYADASTVRITAAAPAEARAASGAVLRLSPLRADGPALVLQWPGALLHGAVALDLSGGGAPDASLYFDTVDWAPGAPFDADGTFTVSRWSAEGASIATDDLGVSVTIAPRGGGRIDLVGPARITGPLGDGEVRDLVARLDVSVTFGAGWRVTPNNGCLPVQMGGLDAAGLSFASGAFALCPLQGALIAADANDRLSGGFLIQRLGLNGHMAGPAAQPARLSASAVTGAFGGRTGDVSLNIQAASPSLTIELAQGRTLAVVGQRLTADARVGDTWRVDGQFEAGVLSDPSLPGAVSAIQGHWSAAPENNRAVIRVEAGEALLTANAPSDQQRPLFHTMRLVDVAGLLRDGQIDATGAIVLEERARRLAQFTATHDVDQGVGSAHINAPNIVFGPNLQPYEISEMARGVTENVRGNASGEADISWTNDAIYATAVLHAQGLSLSTATIPVIQDVRGDVRFDDLFNMTTPPHQELTIGLVNPGIAVRDGRIRFQLLPDRRVAIESAEFAFASGVLAISPTTLQLGSDETHLELSLRDVDASALISQLNIADLHATGQIEGRFPLRLNARSAYIEHGLLRAQGEGGVISYTGQAARDATGMARVAFDALQNFRYDSLQLSLDGDLNDEIVSTITFSGQNNGRPIDLTPIASFPGVGRVTANGVPFRFNVQLTAPFRRLAETAATIVDPETILNRAHAAGNTDTPPQTPVDQQPQPPR